MSLMPDISFGPNNLGNQVGLNQGTINNTFHLPAERSGTPPEPIASIPFCRDPDFIDRGDLLDRLQQICSGPPHRAALVGLGGVGKSQLAIEFAYRFRYYNANAWVFWIHAGTRTRVEEGFRTIANAVQLAGREQPKANVPQLVCQWLSNEQNGQWLIVLDSADNQEVLFGTVDGVEGVKEPPFTTYLPQSTNGCIVVTTRNKQVADRLTGKRDRSIEVGPMTDTEALALLKTKLGSYQDRDEQVAGDLVRTLDLVPLAISQAAAYIRARAPLTSLARYLAEFRTSERSRTGLLAYEAGDLRRDGRASNAVLVTWQISFNHIRSRQPSAADLLALMSFFDRQGIPAWVLNGASLYNGTSHGGEVDSSDSESDDESISDTANSYKKFEDDVAMLRDYCLVTVNEEGSEFEMHNLVQLSTRKWLAISGQHGTFQRQFIERMAVAFPTGVFENWKVCGKLFAHVQAAIHYRPKDDGLDPWATLLHNGAWYAQEQGSYEVAERMAKKARMTREKRGGKEDAATLSSTSLFASIITDRGRWDEAEDLVTEVMETRKTKLGADHPETLISISHLASIYREKGWWNEAERLDIEVMESRKTKLGAYHLDILIAMGNLASTYSDQGRLSEAEKLEVEVMKTFKAKLGPDHPETLTSISNLASTYRHQGRWNEAETLDIEVMDICKTKLGPNHPDTLMNMHNLALTYSQQGRWDDAESLQVKVMEMTKIKLGLDHPDTLISMASLASTYRNQGLLDEAEGLQLKVMETRKTKLGPDHPDTLTSMVSLASTYWKQDRLDEAEKVFVEVMKTSNIKLGPDHPDTLTAMNNLASTYRKQRRWDDTEKLQAEVITLSKTKLGFEHPNTLTMVNNLALTYREQKLWDKAEKLFGEVLEARKTKLGPDHPDTLTSMDNLAHTWNKMGRDSDAVALLTSCVMARQRVLRRDHPDTLSSMAALERWKA